jgi:hypothetical protein
MTIRGRRSVGRTLTVGLAGLAMASLAACTGRGGGYLPPDPVLGFSGQASLGFSFSCQDNGGINPPTGKLAIQLSYNDKGTSTSPVLLSGPLAIHGIVDTIDPVLESAVCIGKNPPPGGNELIFLGRYRPTASTPAGFPKTCQKSNTPTCRFEVIVRDNDGNLAPSKGDYFSIKLSSATALTSELDPATVFYARAGLLAGGNITVK